MSFGLKSTKFWYIATILYLNTKYFTHSNTFLVLLLDIHHLFYDFAYYDIKMNNKETYLDISFSHKRKRFVFKLIINDDLKNHHRYYIWLDPCLLAERIFTKYRNVVKQNFRAKRFALYHSQPIACLCLITLPLLDQWRSLWQGLWTRSNSHSTPSSGAETTCQHFSE